MSLVPSGMIYLDIHGDNLIIDLGRDVFVVNLEALKGLTSHRRTTIPMKRRFIGPDGEPFDTGPKDVPMLGRSGKTTLFFYVDDQSYQIQRDRAIDVAKGIEFQAAVFQIVHPKVSAARQTTLGGEA